MTRAAKIRTYFQAVVEIHMVFKIKIGKEFHRYFPNAQTPLFGGGRVRAGGKGILPFRIGAVQRGAPYVPKGLAATVCRLKRGVQTAL